jgi:hypothetical protein
MSIPTTEDASAVEGAMKKRERNFAPKPSPVPGKEEEILKVKNKTNIFELCLIVRSPERQNQVGEKVQLLHHDQFKSKPKLW